MGLDPHGLRLDSGLGIGTIRHPVTLFLAKGTRVIPPTSQIRGTLQPARFQVGLRKPEGIFSASMPAQVQRLGLSLAQRTGPGSQNVDTLRAAFTMRERGEGAEGAGLPPAFRSDQEALRNALTTERVTRGDAGSQCAAALLSGCPTVPPAPVCTTGRLLPSSATLSKKGHHSSPGPLTPQKHKTHDRGKPAQL